MKPKHQNGFTLIELMIVVAVVGILAAIAYPSYAESVRKGKRAQARTALAELLQQQERYMTQQNCYMSFTTSAAGVSTAVAALGATACGVTAATTVPFKNFSGDSSTSVAYTLSADVCSATLSTAECITVVATPKSDDPKVGTLSISSTGTKSCTAGSDGTTPDAKLCWP